MSVELFNFNFELSYDEAIAIVKPYLERAVIELNLGTKESIDYDIARPLYDAHNFAIIFIKLNDNVIGAFNLYRVYNFWNKYKISYHVSVYLDSKFRNRGVFLKAVKLLSKEIKEKCHNNTDKVNLMFVFKNNHRHFKNITNVVAEVDI